MHVLTRCLVDMQLALVGHDVGHNQILRTRSLDSMIGIGITLFLGASVQWWKYNHNTHHVTPNSSEHDPDIQVRALSASHQTCLCLLLIRKVFWHAIKVALHRIDAFQVMHIAETLRVVAAPALLCAVKPVLQESPLHILPGHDGV